MAGDLIHPFKLASVLLQYPVGETWEAVRDLSLDEVGPLRGQQEAHLRRFLSWYGAQAINDLQRNYVESFDFQRRRSLHLTYHMHGDSRQRGLALLKLKQAYDTAGFDVEERELPDYLPLMLEFASLTPDGLGLDLLDRNRPSIELIRAGLHEDQDPFAELLDAVVEMLPGLTRRQIARIRRLAADGPPTEEVGLEPFAPPEVMPGAGDPPPLPLVGGI